jgi:hypothetical protein
MGSLRNRSASSALTEFRLTTSHVTSVLPNITPSSNVSVTRALHGFDVTQDHTSGESRSSASFQFTYLPVFDRTNELPVSLSSIGLCIRSR